MSYSFGMHFKQVKNKEEAFEVSLQFVAEIYKNAREYLESNMFYIPSIKFDCFSKESHDVINKYADDYWMKDIFTFNIVYWENFELLGLIGNAYPKSGMDLFDCCVHFQNSTDQNYKYDEWNDQIHLFKEKKDFCRNASVNELLAKMPYLDQEDLGIEYYRKTLLYEEIYKTLHLDNWLYDKEDDTFTRFSLSALDSMEKSSKAGTILKIVKKEMQGAK